MRGFIHDLLLIVGLLMVVGVFGRVAEQLTWPRRVARVRRFSMAQYRTIVNRAGWRCEHHSLIFGRCPETDNLEADHVQPHARGGQTAIEKRSGTLQISQITQVGMGTELVEHLAATAATQGLLPGLGRRPCDSFRGLGLAERSQAPTEEAKKALVSVASRTG